MNKLYTEFDSLFAASCRKLQTSQKYTFQKNQKHAHQVIILFCALSFGMSFDKFGRDGCRHVASQSDFAGVGPKLSAYHRQ